MKQTKMHTNNTLLRAVPAIFAVLLLCGVFCGAAAAAGADGNPVTSGDGTSNAPEEPVAKIIESGQTYATLANAVAAVQSGETIVLLKDIALPHPSAGSVALSINKDGITIDGKDADGTIHTISVDETDSNWNQYKVGGTKDAFGKAKLISVSGNNVTLKNMTIDVKDCRGVSCMTTGIGTNGSSVTYENIVCEGRGCGHYYSSVRTGTISFKNCVVNTQGYGIQLSASTSGAGDISVIIDGCTVHGWNAFGEITQLTIKNSSFDYADDTVEKNGIFAVLRMHCPAVIENTSFSEEFAKPTAEAGENKGSRGIDAGAVITAEFKNCKVVENRTSTVSTKYTLSDLIKPIGSETETSTADSLFVIDAVKNDAGKYISGLFVTGNKDSYESLVAPGYAFNQVAGKTNLYNLIAADPAAKIDNTGYATLADAVTAAADGATITLLRDVTDGTGIKVPKNTWTSAGVTLDLGGFTYTVIRSPVGSAGTVNQCFQLNEGNKITIKNGTLKANPAADEKFCFVIQNYADLTLDSVTVDGECLNGDDRKFAYTLSNNCGTVEINGTTSITASTADGLTNSKAFDVYWNKTYYPAGTQVTVNTTGTITGDIEFGVTDTADIASTLKIQNGNFTGAFCLDGLTESEAKEKITITGGIFTEDPSDYLGKDYKWDQETGAVAIFKKYTPEGGILAGKVIDVPAGVPVTSVSMTGIPDTVSNVQLAATNPIVKKGMEVGSQTVLDTYETVFITLLDSDEKTVQPGQPVTVIITAEIPGITSKDNLWVLHGKTVDGKLIWEKVSNVKVTKDDDGYIFEFKTDSFSPFAIVKLSPSSAPSRSSSSSQGSSVWLTNDTPVQPTVTPTPTPVPTQAPVETPGVKPVTPTETPAKTPAPFVGILAGLGAAAVIFGLRRK